MASPDPIAAERAHYLALLGRTVDDPAITLAELRSMTGAGADARYAAEAKITEFLTDVASLEEADARAKADAAVRARTATDHPGTLPLVTGSDDEAFAVQFCTVSADTVNYRMGGRAHKITTTGAVTNAAVVLTPIPPAASGLLNIRPAQAMCAWVYVEDHTKITNVQVELSQDAGNTVFWGRSNISAPAQPLVTGWNLLRWKLVEGLPAAWTGLTANRFRFFLTTNAATTLTLGHVYLETPAKARIIYVADRGYRSFVVNGLPRLRAAGVPITWALDILKLGDHAGEYPNGAAPYADAVTESDVAEFAAAGDSISFHGWTGDPTASMTAAQVRSDTALCIKWLAARGYAGRMWRAAWVQNTAAQHAAVNDYVLGQAMWDQATHSVKLDIWPPRDMQNIARWEFYGKSDANIDNQFALLKKTHGLMVVYNHGIGTGYAYDATAAEFDRFMDNLEEGIAAGWLEATTFEQLFAESGGRFVTAAGATFAEYVDPTGATVRKALL